VTTKKNKEMVQYIIVEPLCGLGSRLRAVASVYTICQTHGKKMILKWLPQEDCDCRFTDLFELPTGVTLYDPSLHSTMKKQYLSTFDDLLSKLLLEESVIDAYELSSSTCYYQQDRQQDILKSFLRSLKPTRRVLSIMFGHQKSISYCIGLHIRIADPSIRFDSLEGQREEDVEHLLLYRYTSSLENFEKIVDYELAKNPLVKFFVASNMESALTHLLSRYGNSTISFCIRRCYNRSLESIQYALADLLLLSKTKYFYGSSWSAFTDVVSYMRIESSLSVPKTTFSTEFSKLLRPSSVVSNEYSLFMLLHELIKKSFPVDQGNKKIHHENTILTHLKKNKMSILQEFFFKKKYQSQVCYDYYKELPLSLVKRLVKLFPDQINMKTFVPSFKLITGKPYDFKYGNHRVGWKAVISNFLKANYVETDDFHYENPTFEWLSYALKTSLNSYEEAITHYSSHSGDGKIAIFEPMKAFIVDDWVEFSYNYHLDIKRSYNIKYFSFTHDPLHVPFIFLKNEFSNFLKKKLESPVYYHNETFQSEKENLDTLFTLSTKHCDQILGADIGGMGTNYKMVYHPMEYNQDNHFDFYSFERSTEKKIYMIGWWMRKYDVFLAMQTGDMTKVIVLKDEEGEWVRDYVMYEIRKVLQKPGLSNSIVQPRYTSEEANEWHRTLNLKVQDYMSDTEYDKIFQGNLAFLDFYDLSASNAIIECILTNTPLLICKQSPCVEYLGEEYPFYFSSLEEASAKVTDMSLICKTHVYLKKMDKSKFTYAYFNKCVREALLNE
jgi:hypothetical protein